MMWAVAENEDKLSVSLGNLKFKNPVLLASGCASFGEVFEGIFDVGIAGALVTKAITPMPREGNPPPRICETASGMLNSIGLQNPGVEVFARSILPTLREKNLRVIANVAGFTFEDYETVVRRLNEEQGIYAYELDLSCPNVADGLVFATNPFMFGSICERIRRITELPLVAKLSPEAGDLVPYAKIAYGTGLDGITVSNTWPAMALDARTGKPKLNTIMGGLSGPAVKPLTVLRVYKCAQAVPDFPILASGGAVNALDVVELIRAGALAVQLGTALFHQPNAPVRILEALESLLEEIGITRVAYLRGKTTSTNA